MSKAAAKNNGIVTDVIRITSFDIYDLITLLGKFQLEMVFVDGGNSIPGSFWGDDEAGLIGNMLYYRNDTPVHSILHEAAHYICMDENRRKTLNTNAGSDVAEENAVCYLQVLLAKDLPGYSQSQLFSDMDYWQYSFRLGSASRWFYEDAEDAKQWLIDHHLTDSNSVLKQKIRL